MSESKQNFLSYKEEEIIKHAAVVIIGIELEEATEELISEFNRYALTLEGFLQSSIHKIIKLVNLRFMSLIFVRSLKPFTLLPPTKKSKYLLKWKISKIPILRTSYITLESLLGWSFYVLERSKKEVGHLGSTLGKENQLPTLLYGKEEWRRPANQ